ncbi:glycosyltransferase family 2 protein [Phormidesmis sp. 146-12]
MDFPGLSPSISIVIPVYNGGEAFRKCLSSLSQCAPPTTEIIVVDDAGTDDSWQVAKTFGATVIRLPINRGPAHARNVGALTAKGELLFFMDADVAIRPDTLLQVIREFDHYPDRAALIGSYDDLPGASNFLSQYKNLLHHYTHQTASEEASTFWGACGAIRRPVFLAIGGFDESYHKPSIEDIELGYRLKRAGYRIRLSKQVQVKHLKRWGVRSLLKADFYDRALPWTRLIWRDGKFINDLNLQTSSRISVVSVYGLVLSLILACGWSSALMLTALCALTLIGLNASLYRFFYHERGMKFALQAIPWHWLYFGYSGLAFAIGSLQFKLQPQIAAPQLIGSISNQRVSLSGRG